MSYRATALLISLLLISHDIRGGNELPSKGIWSLVSEIW